MEKRLPVGTRNSVADPSDGSEVVEDCVLFCDLIAEGRFGAGSEILGVGREAASLKKFAAVWFGRLSIGSAAVLFKIEDGA
jgi:hypothetical protein